MGVFWIRIYSNCNDAPVTKRSAVLVSSFARPEIFTYRFTPGFALFADAVPLPSSCPFTLTPYMSSGES